MVRDAVKLGVPPEDALVMASLNPAVYHRLDHLGAIAPGYQADILLLPDLESFVPELVLKRGRPVAEIPEVAGARLGEADDPRQRRRDERLPRAAGDGGKARVIGLIPDQIVTASLEDELTVENGYAVADPGRDLAKVAVLERHLGTGRIGLGFVRGFGHPARRVRRDARRTTRTTSSSWACRRRRDGPHGRAAARARRRNRRRRGAGRARRAAAPRGRPALRQAARPGARREPCDQRRRPGPGRHLPGAVPDARLPRAVGDPVAEDHRPRARRRRPLRARPARSDRVTEIRTGLTYDDVLLVPRRSRVRSRQDVTARSRFTPGIELAVPIVSANMDTVTTAPMAVAMAQLGGLGVLHRFLPVEEEADEVRRVKRYLTHVISEPYTIAPTARSQTHARRRRASPSRGSSWWIQRDGCSAFSLRETSSRGRTVMGRDADDAARATRHRRARHRVGRGTPAPDREPHREAAAGRRGRCGRRSRDAEGSRVRGTPPAGHP